MKNSLSGLFYNKTFQVFFLVCSSLLLFLGRQLDRGITNFDDAYYGQKAKEIFSSESLWVVLWGGNPSFDNPPLPFWLTGMAYKIFGVSGYATVFSSAIFGVLIIYLTYSICSYLYKDNWTSFLAAFVLIFPGMFLDSSRRGMLDITLAFFITAAMFCLLKGLENRKYYFFYGLMTGCAMLTKSVLGLFPVIIGIVFLFWHGKFRKILDPIYLLSIALALIIGCSWYVVNWYMFEDDFVRGHLHQISLDRYFWSGGSLLYLFGYFKDMLKNYWPWLPFTAIGVFLFAKRGFKERDVSSMFLFLWASIPFVIMSTSRNQTLRYLFMAFPALGIITACTIASWLKDSQKEKALPWMIGIVMTIVLVVNVTPIQVKVSLNQNSPNVKDIAPYVRINTKPGEQIFNYGFSQWNPTQALAFYSDRFLGYPVKDLEVLIQKLKENPSGTWLSPVLKFRDLQKKIPGELYLIYGNQRFAYFTPMKNRENVIYDFSSAKLPFVR